MRKLFVYAVLATTAYVSARAFYYIIEGSLELLLGAAPAGEELRPGGWVAHFFHAGVHLTLFLTFARLLQGDGDLGVESGWAGSWRRLFQLLAGLVGLGLLLTGAADTLNFVWRALLEPFGGASLATVGTGWWQRGIAGSLAAVLVGALAWRLNNLYWNGLLTTQPPEGRMALRRLYLYVATVLAAAITLVPVAMLLRLGVLFLFGAVDTGDIDIDDLTTPSRPAAGGRAGLALALDAGFRRGATLRRLAARASSCGGSTTTPSPPPVSCCCGSGWSICCERCWISPSSAGLRLRRAFAPISSPRD